MCSRSYNTECQQQRQEVASKAGEKNPTQLLTQYGLLSSGLGNSTSAVEIREPQQSQEQQNEGGEEGPSETEVDQMVRVVLSDICRVHTVPHDTNTVTRLI